MGDSANGNKRHSSNMNGNGHLMMEDPSMRDQSPSSGSESQDQDQDHDQENGEDIELDGMAEDKPNPPPQPQKRKGGRKPIYATSEERKQRNRQAQAAFRERRTEYIKQLETTIKQHEATLANLQQSQRTALDECLMLRYKNSLLERVLVEKGIDVQAELHAKSGSPNFGPTRVPASAPSGPQGMRFAGGKFGRRPLSISAKPDSTQVDVLQNRSPLSQPNSGSHLPSPIAPLTRSPNFLPQPGVASISPSFGPTVIQTGQQQLRPAAAMRAQPPFTQPTRPTTFPLSSTQSSASGSSLSSAVRDPQGFFVPAFQNHYDQLDQEYDAQANMLDEPETETGAFPTASFSAPSLPPQQQMQQVQQMGANPNVVAIQQQQQGMATPQQHPQHTPQQHPQDVGTTGFDGGGFDPVLDADPFGLSASMHFPTQFSYDPPR